MPLHSLFTHPLRGIWKIEESVDKLLKQLPNSESNLPELATISSEKRKREWLAIRLLLREVINENLEIQYLPNGKPLLEESDWNISISHTTGYGAILLSKHTHVGIDIEQISARPRNIQTRFLSEKELAMSNKEDDLFFPLIAWSAKETAFKMLGMEGVDFRGHFQILPFSLDKEGTLEIIETRSAQQGICLINYQITDDYVWTYGDHYSSLFQ